MPDILHEVTINGSVDKIYEAITTTHGLQSWWTFEATTEPTVGGVMAINFSVFDVHMKFTVDKLAAQHVTWTPTEGVPDWTGTHVTWDMTPTERGTKVLFGHRNFTTTDGSFAYTSFTWAWYLISLKELIETGKGRPHNGDPTT